MARAVVQPPDYHGVEDGAVLEDRSLGGIAVHGGEGVRDIQAKDSRAGVDRSVRGEEAV